jgi:hypothetical protein
MTHLLRGEQAGLVVLIIVEQVEAAEAAAQEGKVE